MAGIEDFRANLLPEDKLDVIRWLQRKGETVAMLGDGVNDAPALTLSDVGIAMGAMGTDIAVESSDIALMSDNLSMIPEVFALSRKALGTIKENIWVFAVGVNIAGIALASTGILSPIAAAIIHNAASAMVVLNSSRLLLFKSNI
jgi:P-type E1-E2 ATPase